MATTTLKTYRAPTIGEALTQVKKDLGKDAVILHTRSYKVGSILGFFGKPVVEITASVGVNVVNPLDLRRAARRPEPAGAKSRAEAAAPAPPAPPDLSPGTPATGSASPRSVSARPVSPRPVSPRAVQRAYGAEPVAVFQSASPGPFAPGANPAAAAAAHPGAGSSVHRDPREAREMGIARAAIEQANLAGSSGMTLDLHEELSAIKCMVAQVLQSSARAGGAPGAASPAPAMPGALLKFYLRLIQNDVSREIADELAASLRDELTPGELADEEIVRQSTLRHLATLIPTDAQVAAPQRRPGDGPLTIALVGPTGVGKTTTVAKLAAAYRLRHGKKVALVTSDTYRIAAVDQLRTYANIIGVPLHVAHSPEQMAEAVAQCSDCDVVLIDTAGRSPGDTGRLEELRDFLAAASPQQVHLVLASVASEGALMRTAEQFAIVSPSRIIFTKLDEAASFGVLVNVAHRLKTRLSFVTTGQEVPDDIEPGRADRLARLILDGSVAA